MSKPDGIPRCLFRETICEELIDDILNGRLLPVGRRSKASRPETPQR